MTWADFVVRGTLVLAAGFAASFALGRASAALRHLIWTAAFGALLVLPVALRLAPKVAIAPSLRSMRPQAGVGRLKPAPPLLLEGHEGQWWELSRVPTGADRNGLLRIWPDY